MKITSEGLLYAEDEDYANWSGQLQATAQSADAAIAARQAAITTGLTQSYYSANLSAFSAVPANFESFLGISSQNYSKNVSQYFLASTQVWQPNLSGWFRVVCTVSFALTGALTPNAVFQANIIINDSTNSAVATGNLNLSILQTYYTNTQFYTSAWSPAGLEVNVGTFVEINSNTFITLSAQHTNTASDVNILGVMSLNRVCPSVI